MKKLMSFGVAAAVLLSAFAVQAQQPITFRISNTVPRPSEPYVLLDYVAKRTAELTGGKIVVEVLQPFASERDMFEQVLLGQLQGQSSSADAFSQWVPEARIFSLPYFYNSVEEAIAVGNGPVGETIRKKAEAKGFKILGFMPISVRALISKAAVDKSADIKGRKIRIINSPIWIGLYQSVGAIPVPMDWSDTYTGLQTGVIDLLDAGISGSLATKHFEVAKVAVATDHAYQFQVITTSVRFWKTLTPEQREAMSRAVEEGLPIELQAMKKKREIDADEWRKVGGTVMHPTEEFNAAMRKAAESAMPIFAQAVGGEEVIKAAQKSMGR